MIEALDFRKAWQFGAFGGGGGLISGILGEALPHEPASSLLMAALSTGLWLGILGACVATALLAGQSFYLQRGLRLRESALAGALPGFLAGAGAGFITNLLYNLDATSELLRVFCWGLMGTSLGLALSFLVPNLQRKHGLLGGAMGGGIGGGLFVLVAVGLSHDTIGRLLGTCTIGAAIGLMIAVVEAAFREAWLEISYRPREVRRVSLGQKAVSIGSDPERCTVQVRDVPAVALRYQLVDGRISCEDVVTGRVSQVGIGDRRTIGSVTVIVRGVRREVLVSPDTHDAQQHRAKDNYSPSPITKDKQFTLQISSGQTFPLRVGTRLNGRDIPGLEAPAGNGIVAEVVRNPQDITILGLKNLSQRTWAAQVESSERQVEPGKSVRLELGTKISFVSMVEGVIRE